MSKKQTDNRPDYDINPHWVASYFETNLDDAMEAIAWLYDSDFFHDHLVIDIAGALETIQNRRGV